MAVDFNKDFARKTNCIYLRKIKEEETKVAMIEMVNLYKVSIFEALLSTVLLLNKL